MHVRGETRRPLFGRPSLALFAAATGGLLAALLLAPGSRAEAPRRLSPPEPQESGPTDVRFTGDAAFIISYIRTDKSGDFEAVMARVKQALDSSPAPERKTQAAGWKLFKSPDGAPEGQVLYISVVTPVARQADYSVPKILSEVFPADVRALYDRYLAAFGRGQDRINATLVASMGQ